MIILMSTQHIIVKFQLPSHCSDEKKFDSNLTSASVQDVKELVRFIVITFQTNIQNEAFYDFCLKGCKGLCFKS